MRHHPAVLAFLAVLSLFLGAVPGRAVTPPAAGPNFQVNAATQGPQLNPDVAQDVAGNFVAVWTDGGTLPATVKARLFDASGAPAGGEIVVATLGQTSSSPPRVAMTPLGAFAVVWGKDGNVGLRRFDRLGRPLGDILTVDDGQSHSPDVAVDAAGNAFVVWVKSRLGSDAVFLQRLDAANRLLGLPEQVDQSAAGVRDHPRVAVGPAGSLLVSWDDDRAGLSGVQARRFDGPSGAWAPEVRIHPDPSGIQQGSAPLFGPQGEGAVVFSDFTAGKVLVRRLDATGAVLGDPIPLGDLGVVDFSAPDAAIGPGGTAFVVWQGEDRHVHGGFFDQDWRPLEENFPVSSPIPQLLDLQPAVAAGPAGFVAAWTNGVVPPLFPSFPPGNGLDGSEFGIFAQRFGFARCAAGSTVLCLGADGRFEARVSWKNPYTGETGTGKALPLTGGLGDRGNTGAFWFFDAANLELMIKVLDGGAVNGHFWVFYGSLSNVEYTITLTDTTTGTVKTYHNPPLQLASHADVEAFLSAAASTAAGLSTSSPALIPAPPSSPPLSLGQGRFQVQVDFVDPRTGIAGQGQAVTLTGDTGAFWFFDPANLELMVKVLDGRAINGHFWVFYGALSDVEYTITVTDTATGGRRTYHNPPHHLASGADISSFPIPVSAH